MVAIKDMKMPSCCAKCERFLGACKYVDFGDYRTERNPNCPLVEIKALEQEPKTGHWIFKNENDQICLIYTCDKCGEQICILDNTIKSPQEGHYNFCPNCGAKMESEEKE